jgi:hypothetical protein
MSGAGAQGTPGNSARQQTIQVQRGLREHGDPLVPVQAEVRGPFALVEESDWWELYHLGTGLLLSNLFSKRRALACVEALVALEGVDWSFAQPEAFRASPASAQSLELVQRFEQQDGWRIGRGGWKWHPKQVRFR